MTPANRPISLDTSIVREAQYRASELGYGSILWQASSDYTEFMLQDLGFVLRDRLVVLIHRSPKSWRSFPTTDNKAVSIRRGHADDLGEVLSVDSTCFEPFWRLDAMGLDEAILATPRARYRVAVDTSNKEIGSPLVGYVVTGYGIGIGFLQRIAVHPSASGQRIGTALISDGFRWLSRWGARSVSVNTQATNNRALSLYQSLGFERQERGIALYESPLNR